jgi:hypothetical protein
MGVLDTTYTFTATDIVTSTKLNNVLDQAVFTAGAITGTTLAVTTAGLLKVESSGITANEIASNSVTTAKILDANVTTAKVLDANITQAKLAANVVGNGPAFRAYAATLTSLTNGVITKVTLDAENFDTNSNFASSRFTPTVAGYYQINAAVNSTATNPYQLLAILRKNGTTDHSLGSGQVAGASYRSIVSDIIEMNGTTDFIEFFAYHLSGVNINTQTGTTNVYMSGCLIRTSP